MMIVSTQAALDLAERADQAELLADDPVGDWLRSLAYQRDQMQRALDPFSKMAAELFARNYNAEDIVLQFQTPEGETIKLDFADFMVVNDALKIK